jgi:hypothetical protein
LHSCFRLSKTPALNFRNLKNVHLLLIPEDTLSLFSIQNYSGYVAKRFHHVSGSLLYLRYRRLLI